MRWMLISTLLCILPACAIDARSSMRPRSIDVYSSTGQSRYYGEMQKDWSIGANVRFDMYYEDEY